MSTLLLRKALRSGYVLEVHSCDLSDPLVDHPEMGEFYCWHGRYRLGSFNAYPSPAELLAKLCRQYRCRLQGLGLDCVTSWQQLEAAEKVLSDKGLLLLPLYMYDHSGLAFATSPFSCPWDSGRLGYVVIKPVVLRKYWRGDREAASSAVADFLRCEYHDYVNGHGVDFSIIDSLGDVVTTSGPFSGCDYDSNGLFEEADEIVRELLTPTPE